MEGYYEAQVSFTHPSVTRRFRQHGRYFLDDGAVEALEPLIERGWLTPLPAHEAEGYVRIDPAVGDPDDGGNGAGDGDASEAPPSPSTGGSITNPAAQDPAGEGDGGSRPGEAPTPPASALSAGSPPSPVTEG